MQSPRNAAIAAIVGLVAIVVLFLVLSGEEESDTPTTPTTTQSATLPDDNGDDDQNSGNGQGDGKEPAEEATVIEIVDGQPVDGVAEIVVDKGDPIEFTVKSDAAYEVHMHGYDVAKDVEPGGSVTFDVPATIDGVFEVELEETVTPIAEITVNP